MTYAFQVLRAAQWDLRRAMRMVERYLLRDENYYFNHDHSIKLMADQLHGLLVDVPAFADGPTPGATCGGGPRSEQCKEVDLVPAAAAKVPGVEDEDEDENQDEDEDVPVAVLIRRLEELGFSVTRATELVDTATRPDDRVYINGLCRMTGQPHTLGERTPIEFIEQALSDPFYTGVLQES